MKLNFLSKLMGRNKEHVTSLGESTGHNPGVSARQESPLLREQRYVGYAEDLFSKGYSEAQVIDSLKREGLSFDEIDSIISKALKSKVSGESADPGFNYQEGKETLQPDMRSSSDPMNFGTEEFGIQAGGEETITPIGQGTGGLLASESQEILSLDEVESLVETMIEDKMKEINELITGLADKIEELERKINMVSSSVEDEISRSREGLETFSGDLRELKDTISKIEPRLNSLEKAFKDIVPNLVDSVREVKEIVHDFENRMKRHSLSEEETPTEGSKKEKTRK